MGKGGSRHSAKSQMAAFRKVAKVLECDEDENKFNLALAKIGRKEVPDDSELEAVARKIGNLPPASKKRS